MFSLASLCRALSRAWSHFFCIVALLAWWLRVELVPHLLHGSSGIGHDDVVEILDKGGPLFRIGQHFISLLYLVQPGGCLLFLFFARPVQLVGWYWFDSRR